MSRGCWGLGTQGLPPGAGSHPGFVASSLVSPGIVATTALAGLWGEESFLLSLVGHDPLDNSLGPIPNHVHIGGRSFVHDFQQIYGPQIKRASALDKYSFFPPLMNSANIS